MHPQDEPEELFTVAQLHEHTMLGAEKGTHCPVCHQTVKLYPRSISKRMASDLIKAVRLYGTLPFRAIEFISLNTDFYKLQFWGLLEEAMTPGIPGAKAGGWWQITKAGVDFANGRYGVTRYAMVYNNMVVRMGGKVVTIHDCVEAFDFDKLWGRETIRDAGGENATLRQGETVGAPPFAADSGQGIASHADVGGGADDSGGA